MSHPDDTLSPETVAAQALSRIDPSTGAVVPPIHPSTTYLRDADNSYATHGRVYSRADNPTYEQVEAVLNRLEGGEGALVLASGMAAATAPVMALAPGDHVVASDVMYWGYRNWLADYARSWGIEVDFVPSYDLEALAAALKPGRTKLVWVETPANPMWWVTDIQGAAELAHGAGARLAVDSTAASPVVTRPLELGADIVMHSGTKYLNGHSDVVAGVLVTARDDAYWQRIVSVRRNLGAILGPFEAWLLLRGLRTLFPRVRSQCANALDLARALEGYPGVSEVLYPGLASHPHHEVARRQMRDGFGGMLSIRLEGGERAAVKVAAGTRLFIRATSLGGVESLIEHRASIEGPDTPVPSDLLRLSVGIEAVEDLIEDLTRAIDAAR